MSLKKTIIFIVCIFAAILIPLGLIGGAVSAINNYSEYQVDSTPQANITVNDIESSTAHLHFSIDRSNFVIDSSANRTLDDEEKATDEASTTKYKYVNNYNILLINMTNYYAAEKNIKGNQVISVQGYVDHTMEIYNNQLTYDGSVIQNGLQSFEINDVYRLTADTLFSANKEYYTQETATEYKLADVKADTEVERGVYYEKVKETTFDFYIGNLEKNHTYAIAVQFYYSLNDKGSVLYNRGLSDRYEFTTAK